MKRIDARFSRDEINHLKKMVDRKMIKFKCDPFIITPKVYGVVGITFEDIGTFKFSNFIQTADHFGHKEDVSFFKVDHLPVDNLKSLAQDLEMIERPIHKVVKEVVVVNECQKLFENNELTYEVYVTRAVIFKFTDDSELSIEKNVWFSEDITVRQGKNLIEKLKSTDEFGEEWNEDPFYGECYRDIIILSAKEMR